MKKSKLKIKKLLSASLALIMVFSVLSIMDLGYAMTSDINVDVPMTTATQGVEDMPMFRFKCTKSGVYSFYQTNSRRLEAYLFIKEKQPDGSKKYEQLAFSNGNPDYQKFGQSNANCFCITYRLEAGKTYFFGVVAPYEGVSSAEVKVMLTCKAYDENLIDRIEAKCDAKLKWYTDGEWKTDANLDKYFEYNISRIMSNTQITVYYTDGTSKTLMGPKMIDGIPVLYQHNQLENHWYVPNDELYTSNDLIIKILNKSVTLNVEIEQGALYPVKGRVVDYNTNQPIEGALILLNSQNIAQTDSNGNYAFSSSSGNFELKIKTNNSIDKVFNMVISSDDKHNDTTATPHRIITCDYVNDEVINTKDSAFVNRSDMTNEIKQSELSNIDKLLGADKSIY